MKRAMMLLLVALLVAMSVTVFGQGKKAMDSTKTNAMTIVITASKPVIEPGETAIINIEVGGNPGECFFVCNGDTVKHSFEVTPKKTTTYVIGVYERATKKFIAAGKITLGVGQRLRYKETLPDTFLLGHTNPKEIRGWQKAKKAANDFLSSNQGVEFRKKFTGSADLKGNASEQRNIDLANRRAQRTMQLFGIEGELGKITGDEYRTVYIDFEETDASFFARTMKNGIGMGMVIGKADTVRIITPAPVVKTPKPKTDRLRVVAGTWWLHEAPMVGGGLYLPLSSDSLGSVYDLQLRAYFGGGNVGRPGPSDWAVSMQVDGRIAKNLYLGPILAVGQHFDYRSGLGDRLDASLGLLGQWRPKKWFAMEAAALYTHRIYGWCGPDRKKMSPDRDFVNGMGGVIFMF